MSAGTTSAYPLDRFLDIEPPVLDSLDAQREFEQIPYADRIVASSTLDALRAGASVAPDEPAIQFLPNADPDEAPLVISYTQFVGQVVRIANLFHPLRAVESPQSPPEQLSAVGHHRIDGRLSFRNPEQEVKVIVHHAPSKNLDP